MEQVKRSVGQPQKRATHTDAMKQKKFRLTEEQDAVLMQWLKEQGVSLQGYFEHLVEEIIAGNK